MALTKIAETVASGSGNIAFTSGIDATYKVYMFKFIECHPSAAANVTFQVSTDGGSNYNINILSSAFRSINNESGSDAKIEYRSAHSYPGTGYQFLTEEIKADADGSGSGYVMLYDPSNTTVYKQFSALGQCLETSDYSQQLFIGGICNTTSAINAANFKLNTGNIDTGTIQMWGL